MVIKKGTEDKFSESANISRISQDLANVHDKVNNLRVHLLGGMNTDGLSEVIMGLESDLTNNISTLNSIDNRFVQKEIAFCCSYNNSNYSSSIQNINDSAMEICSTDEYVSGYYYIHHFADYLS